MSIQKTNFNKNYHSLPFSVKNNVRSFLSSRDQASLRIVCRSESPSRTPHLTTLPHVLTHLVEEFFTFNEFCKLARTRKSALADFKSRIITIETYRQADDKGLIDLICHANTRLIAIDFRKADSDEADYIAHSFTYRAPITFPRFPCLRELMLYEHVPLRPLPTLAEMNQMVSEDAQFAMYAAVSNNEQANPSLSLNTLVPLLVQCPRIERIRELGSHYSHNHEVPVVTGVETLLGWDRQKLARVSGLWLIDLFPTTADNFIPF
jgi:hypothetical protein